MINQGLIPLNVIHDMLQTHCKGDFDMALMLRDVILAKGALMGCSSYLALVDSLCRMGKLTEASNLLKEMEEIGIRPGEDQCLMLLNNLHTSRFIQEYNKVFDTMLCHKWLQKDNKFCTSAGDSLEAVNAKYPQKRILSILILISCYCKCMCCPFWYMRV